MVVFGVVAVFMMTSWSLVYLECKNVCFKEPRINQSVNGADMLSSLSGQKQYV